MQKYSWKKQENTEQGEPGSYERLRKPLHGLHVHTVWAILYSENVGTHTKDIKNTTLKTPKKVREIYFLNGAPKSGKWTEIDRTFWKRIPGIYDAFTKECCP